MDPLIGAIVAAVIFLVTIGLAYYVIPLVGGLIGGIVADGEGIAVGAVLGYILASAYAIFALIFFVINVVRIIQLATGAISS